MDCPEHKQRAVAGFTLTELVTVMTIVGILAAFVAPRFFDRVTFESRGFADQVQAALRYAQKSAIAQHRFVCAAFTADSIALTIGATNACGTPLASLTGDANYVISARPGVSISPVPATFSFNALGQPRNFDAPDQPVAAVSVNIVGDTTRTITVEAETGYVHQ